MRRPSFGGLIGRPYFPDPNDDWARLAGVSAVGLDASTCVSGQGVAKPPVGYVLVSYNVCP